MKYKQIEPIIEEIKKRTKTEAFSLSIDSERRPGLYDSKFGGVPYWDREKKYPVSEKGDKLMFLAQFNLEQHDFGRHLPDKGMLQFFILADDVFGLDFEHPDRQNTFRVVYHEQLKKGVTKEEVMELDIPVSLALENEDYTPIWGEYALNIKKTYACMGIDDGHFYPLFRQIAKELHIKLPEDNLYGILGDEAYDELAEEMNNGGHWLLGYPTFTQFDPREDEKYTRYDTMLFQMDSDFGQEEDYILWGDAGVGNFFINKEDLKNRDFSKILYNWDCC